MGRAVAIMLTYNWKDLLVECIDGLLRNDVLKKLSLVGKDLSDYSLDTVKMFHDDASAAGYRL